MTAWQAFFPESIRVNDKWLCDATVFNGTEKIPVTVTYDRDVSECLPVLQAAAAKRDSQTLKPPAPIPAGTTIDLTPVVPVVVTPTQAQLDQAAWLTARATVLQCQRGLSEGIPGFDQARLDTARSNRDKLYQVAYEAFV